MAAANPYADTTSGRLVFRRAGVAGSWSDPALAYSLAAGETRTFADLIAAMGESGIGSVDVVTDTADTARPPIAVAHVYSIRADGDTLGLTEEAFDPNDMSYQCSASTGQMIETRVLRTGVTGFLIAPQWPAQERLNIGVRSLASGATITATVLNAAGSVIHTATRSYAPHLFEQRSAEDFLGFTLTGGESIRITVNAGSAIVYGATTDNTTNDPAIQYVYSLFLPETQ